MPRVPSPGDYVHSDVTLYCVEAVSTLVAVAEDCRTGELVEFELRDLMALERVDPARASSGRAA